jgi:hypothetical protein
LLEDLKYHPVKSVTNYQTISMIYPENFAVAVSELSLDAFLIVLASFFPSLNSRADHVKCQFQLGT